MYFMRFCGGTCRYLRTYQGTLRKGDFVTNNRTGKKTKVPRLVRMHANQMVDVPFVNAGEICAMFGLECQSGDAFGDGSHRLLLESM